MAPKSTIVRIKPKVTYILLVLEHINVFKNVYIHTQTYKWKQEGYNEKVAKALDTEKINY